MNCMIIDDEPLALDLVEDNIKKIPFLKLVNKCKTVAEALESLNKHKIDLIFLDIEMPNINGLQFMHSLKNKPMIIIISAYEKYAMEGFENDVIDYLLKPVSFDRFLKAINKANEYFNFRNSTEIPEKIFKDNQYIFVKSDRKLVKIVIDDIMYVEGYKDYVKIYLTQKPILTLLSMKYLEEILPPDKFVRIHRSFIISISNIEYVGKSKVFINSRGLQISDFYRDIFFSRIKGML